MASVLQLAGMLPRDPQFRAFVGYFMAPPRDDVSIDEASAHIRDTCKVGSRRELATDRGAEQRFHEFIRKPFVRWRARQEEHA